MLLYVGVYVCLTVAGVVSGHPAGMCTEGAFHSPVQKIMKWQSGRARHNEGRERRKKQVGKQANHNIHLSRQPY